MGILYWALLGLVAGFLAKFLMPGKDGGGLLMTMALGVVGAIVGGFIAQNFLGMSDVDGFNLWSLAVATGGALLVLVGYRMLKRSTA